MFLPDYDMAMAKRLYPGCDVWMNNPLRPYEACGTSGMKAASNGGESVDSRRLVGRVVRSRVRLGDPSAEGADGSDHRDDLEANALTTPSKTRSCRASTILTSTACRSAGFR